MLSGNSSEEFKNFFDQQLLILISKSEEKAEFSAIEKIFVDVKKKYEDLNKKQKIQDDTGKDFNYYQNQFFDTYFMSRCEFLAEEVKEFKNLDGEKQELNTLFEDKKPFHEIRVTLNDKVQKVHQIIDYSFEPLKIDYKKLQKDLAFAKRKYNYIKEDTFL